MNPIINYNELWRILHQRRRAGGQDWDKRAHSFFKAVSGNNDAEKVIPSLNLTDSDTVLDMGAGTGRIAVPMAKYAAHVTALEPSSGMASCLEKSMEEEGLSNYTLVRKRWEDVKIGQDIPVHDVVFASNSLGFPDLADGLKKLDAAARKAVHILWFAGPQRHPMDPELKKRLGREEERDFGPDYIFIAQVLHDMGIYANVEVHPTRTVHRYENLDEAVAWWEERGDISPEEKPILREFLSEKLNCTVDGHPVMQRNGWRARIWWEKENRAE
ncbi:class I SAM-dependent methyltransferase [Methanospirillum sp. J.3.6.1-F.2.7.3]|uniref:Class I SAM-dependent methyltransferase n=1 Tax=Methanospirillum purgamenti TaxID=2834276 RepID=A0A8E7EJ87_9EURY|nr:MULTISPECIES: class I SAM-dependent methyltransferase [Methanospirillum]MDX8551236.1 class I SAM-dependent methyltransferase [Methanospirillum hungatei]QVV88200.1 class I SAM-dependent methyltransferase [Methanospirillum sp. J.3.6.1-F.2.7.3]